MRESLNLFILAGEPSGDRIAAQLVQNLRKQVDVALAGVGGDELEGQGVRSIFPMSDLAVMGVTDVLLNLPRLLWRLEQTARAILVARPDVVILVDAQDFSRLLAKRLRDRGYTGKLILYVAPSVWARHPERAAKLRPLFDAVLAVLPFEPAVMTRLGGPPTHYVGHPALEEQVIGKSAGERGPVILLPGSRTGELRRHLPLFKAVAAQLSATPEVTRLVMPTLRRLRPRLEQELSGWGVPVDLVDDRSARRTLYAEALAALCVSGTVTLELALARVPMVVAYALDNHQARVFDRLNRPAVSLPNIILDRSAVPEFVSTHLDPETLGLTMLDLVGNKKARQGQIDAFDELAKYMEAGQPPFGREDPAEQVLAIWRDQREPISS
jgi:lipid-A-disaccharide synthase